MMMRFCAVNARRASSIAIPGNVVGITSSDPSSSGGMNSDPSRWNVGTVAIMRRTAAATTTNPEADDQHRDRPVDGAQQSG